MKFTLRKYPARNAWKLDYRLHGKRHRQFFKTKELAVAEQGRISQSIDNSGSAWIALSAGRRNEIISVIQEIETEGLTLRTVWENYRRSDHDALPSKTLRQAVDECIGSKRTANRRAKYLSNLEWLLFRFIKNIETRQVSSVTVAQIEKWLEGKSLITRKTYSSHISVLFAFCKRRGYISENPFDRLDKISIEAKPPIILSVEQCAGILAWSKSKEPQFLGWLCLTLLCGLRPEEADKQPQSAVDLKAGFVRVDAATSKVRNRRLVPITPAAKAWLELATEARWQMPHITRRRMQRRMRDQLGFKKLPQDILRHTCASYWMAHEQDAGKVASWLGNSASILLRHYRELVTREEAVRFWELDQSV